jgi:hypothetical protein
MNDVADEVKRGPGRPKRSEEVTERRRRRDAMGMERNLKLHVPTELKDPNFEYRWVNERPGRVHQMTKGDDWDVVSALTGETGGEGTVETRVVDKAGDKAVLLRKRKDFYESDKAEEQKAIAQREEDMKRAAPPDSEGLKGPHAYVPGGQNIIGR